MSRRKRQKQQPSRKVNPASSASKPATSTQQPAQFAVDESDKKSFLKILNPRQFLIIAICITIVWYLFLGMMAIWTSNPVTLNWKQIDRADVVISGHITNVAVGLITIEKTWKQSIELETITIKNLDQANAKPNETYLMPLTTIDAGDYQVVLLPAPANFPVVYPATEEAIEQLERMLFELQR